MIRAYMPLRVLAYTVLSEIHASNLINAVQPFLFGLGVACFWTNLSVVLYDDRYRSYLSRFHGKSCYGYVAATRKIVLNVPDLVVSTKLAPGFNIAKKCTSEWNHSCYACQIMPGLVPTPKYETGLVSAS